ncbi:MAG TPA: hypothetical protein VGL38_02050 [bacterium]
MLRLFGTVLICFIVVLLVGSSTAFAWDSPQKYGVEVRGGFGKYDMGDVTPGIESLRNDMKKHSIATTLSEKDQGPMGGFSLLFRPSKHAMWEIGFNALLDVENKAEQQFGTDTTSAQMLMHANEFFVKGNAVATITDYFHVDFGAGLSYYNAELQVQDRLNSSFVYDAVGRAFGLIGGVNAELLVTKRVGVILGGGGRIANTSNFTYWDPVTRQRTYLKVIGGSRPIEVNLSGAYANAGLRFYFDPVTKPVDFTR